MADADRALSDYIWMRKEMADIETSVSSLLDEMVNSLERAEHPMKIEEKAKMLADEARRIAYELRDADDLEMNEKMVELENLEQRAGGLMEKIPDAVIYTEQKKWAGELEQITSNLHKLKEGMGLLSLQNIGARQRKNSEATMKRIIIATKARVEVAKERIINKSHAQKHKTYLQLGKIKVAIANVKEHISKVGKKEERKMLEPKANELANRMKMFFANCLEGRAYIDWETIKVSSKITGEEMEWAHDETGEMALGMIFGNSHLGKMVSNLKERKACVVADFFSKQDAGAILLEFDAGERKITDGGIIFETAKSRIMV